MAAFQEVNVRAIGRTCTVPNNDVAKLMYYLSCVTKDVGLDVIQDDLVDFENYWMLSRQRADMVFIAALRYSPDELINKLIFLDEEGEICGNSLNKFLSIERETTLLTVQRSALIAGQQTNISKIMVFKKQWLDIYFFEPMRRNQGRIQRILA